MTQECVGQEKGPVMVMTGVKMWRKESGTVGRRTTGRQVPARTMGLPCRDGCWDKITRPIVTEINKEFWEIRDFALQNAYIQKCVREKKVKRRRQVQNPEAERRRSKTNGYTLTYGNVTHVVRMKGFLSILAISETRVRTALLSVSVSGSSRGDLRGCHVCPRRVPEEVVN